MKFCLLVWNRLVLGSAERTTAPKEKRKTATANRFYFCLEKAKKKKHVRFQVFDSFAKWKIFWCLILKRRKGRRKKRNAMVDIVSIGAVVGFAMNNNYKNKHTGCVTRTAPLHQILMTSIAWLFSVQRNERKKTYAHRVN